VTFQHIVVVKSFKESDKLIAFRVYNSNAPDSDKHVFYDKKRKMFFGNLNGTADEMAELGAFIVDEQERGPLEDAMLRYYQGLCGS
jgi:hypothetical protein